MRKKYTEVKECKICGYGFSESSFYGNPYNLCPECRYKKQEEIKKFLVKKEKK